MPKLNDALQEIKNNIEPNEEFLVKDLFKGYVWKRMTIAERIALGNKVKYAVAEDSSLGIKPTEKTTSNQQKYKKI